MAKCWVPKSIKNQDRKKSDFWRIRGDPWGRSKGTGGVPLKTEYGFMYRDRQFILHAATSTWTVLRRILGVLGYPRTSIWRSWGALGVPFWGSGGPLGRFQRAVASKDPCTKLAPHHFNRFWSQTGPQKAPTMELKSIKNRFKNLSKFWSDFEAVSGSFWVILGVFLGTWTLKNECLV